MPTPKNILIADDENAILKLFEKMFRDENYRLFLASDGEKAVQLAKKHPMDVAILDLIMPKMGGVESLKEIKGIDEHTEVLIITEMRNCRGLKRYSLITVPLIISSNLLTSRNLN